jgi:hypothetical protein
MKKILLSFLFLLFSFSFLSAQNNLDTIITIECNGKSYNVSQKFPTEIIGEYLYYKKGNPRAFLRADGTGYFHRKEERPPAIQFWVECDEKGAAKRNYSFDSNFYVTLVYQYTDEELRKLWGEYQTMEVRVDYGKGYAIIFQERFHNFRE